MPRLWQPHEDAEILRLRASGSTHKQIAEAFGATVDSVEKRFKRLRAKDVEIPIHVEEPQRRDRPDITQLVQLARGGADLEEICDRMNAPPKRVRELVEDAQRLGYTVAIDGPHVGFRPAMPSAEVHDVHVAAAGERRIFAQITDLHYGSRYCLPHYIDDFVEKAYARGVRSLFISGDIVEGMYRHARWELTHHGWHDQSAYVAQRLPRKPGLTYYGISGNHDETFEKEAGLDVCRAFVEVFATQGRHDLVMLGARGGRVRMCAPGDTHGVQVELWHPLGGGAYAVSYKLQKKIEGYAPGQKPDFLFVGHFHQSCAVHLRGVHAYQGGTFQGGGGPFGRALGSSPSIGGWVVSYTQTPDGTVRDVDSSWVAYYEGESPIEVAV